MDDENGESMEPMEDENEKQHTQSCNINRTLGKSHYNCLEF